MYNAAKVRALNNEFRTTFKGGRVMVTQGVSALPDIVGILERVKTFTDFSPKNDPHGEADFGSFTLDSGELIFFKIDYYDVDLMNGSPDPTDVAVTSRVMTVMLAEEI